jgi:acyl carrier protein
LLVESAGGFAVKKLTIDEFIAQLRDGLLTDYPGDLAPETNFFTDIGLDSLEMFHIVVFIEDLTGFEISIEEPPQLGTVADAYDLYRGVVSALPAGADRP